LLAVASGVIHPLQGGWYFDEPIRLEVAGHGWMIVIRDSQFHVFLEADEPDDVATFTNEISSIVQGCVDSLGFHLASALRAETKSMIIDGRTLVLKTTTWPELLTEPGSPQVEPESLSPFVVVAAAEPLVRLALADLRTAIESPDDTLFLCYRAVESVRQWFLVGDEDDKSARFESWLAMRTTLDLEEGPMRRLEKAAMGRRHGAVHPPTAIDRLQALQLAREVVSRLIAHIRAQSTIGGVEQELRTRHDP
jgi:hypothetical protein